MSSTNTFEQLGLNASLLKPLAKLGYEIPTPIQEKTIPILLDGHDMVAQAQTGTGKTAAFALPILNNINLKKRYPQALVLAPTRELAIQVAESFHSYAKELSGFHVLPIYGGTDFRGQLKALERGAHVVVGTPGRVMDHLRRGTLSIERLTTIVLDEADEMLKMGFIDDVEWILEQIKGKHQTALFSATMPRSIRKVAEKYLSEAQEVQIKSKTSTGVDIEQLYMMTSKHHKIEALTRFLEVEEVDATLIFTRTKTYSTELAEKLEARGYSVAALNGDMSQGMREKVISRLKRKSLDIVIATDVAARGLDVERISHVVNYDIPYDIESYVHRIGRTGRAGRKGKSLTFVSPRERRMLRDIERSTKQQITLIQPPTVSEISQKRITAFGEELLATIANGELDYYREIVEKLAHESEHSTLDVAAALVALAQKQKPFIMKDKEISFEPEDDRSSRRHDSRDGGRRDGGGYRDGGRRDNGRRDERRSDSRSDRKPRIKEIESDMVRCRIAVGRDQGIGPGDLVGVICDKGSINSKNIGPIHIFNDFSLIDISDSVVEKVLKKVGDCKVRNNPLKLRLDKQAK